MSASLILLILAGLCFLLAVLEIVPQKTIALGLFLLTVYLIVGGAF